MPERSEVLLKVAACGLCGSELESFKNRGIVVCNVPDYCIGEVADHAVSLALALARQLPMISTRLRSGIWKLTPDRPMPAFHQMTFATAGFGRIAREVLTRVQGFGFKLAAYDPFVPDNVFEAAGVQKLTLDTLFDVDILSLHLPLTPQTRHLIDKQSLSRMKRTAIVVNTARGPLIDTHALAVALQSGLIAAVGLDVFESEPLVTILC